ncbi:MAG: flagellar basal body rod protein FlgC [Rhodospirillales bacterium 20-64-7]|nr:MAG: flagellar basal body rod protein FlgC [Rhodospirillales bacterium 20-64-7]HQT77241.1 flagellar basal body rod protein FlgC [Rhodopila sp.]
MNALIPISGNGPLSQTIETAASGMRAQATRLRLVAENLANSESTAAVPGGSPYQRKVMTFEQAVDHATGAAVVKPGPVSLDPAPFRSVYDPSHPAANAQGYVSMPNVSPVLEVADMREAERSYEANLAALNQARSMISKTIDILKA